MDRYTAALDYARKLGTQHGTNAAGWYTQDAFGGRVTRGADDAASRIIAGMEDGDPAIYDTFPTADLSGQWAGMLSGPELVNDALSDVDIFEDENGNLPDEYHDWFGDICDAYESAFAEAAADEIERAARVALTADTLRCNTHGERTWWPAYWTSERPACWDCGQPSDRMTFTSASRAQTYAARCRRAGVHAVVWRKGPDAFEVRFPS